MRMIVVPLRWKLIVLFVAIVLMVTAVTVAALLHAWSMPVEQLLVDPRLRTLARVSVASALVWTLISAALASFYVHRITGPLGRVLHAAAAVEAGNLDVQVPVPESDEIGIFTARFNRLVATLKRQEDEKAKLLEDLHRANAQLSGDVRRSERLAALGTLSAGLAHELNNLLNIISGYASVVRKEAGPESRFCGSCRAASTTRSASTACCAPTRACCARPTRRSRASWAAERSAPTSTTACR